MVGHGGSSVGLYLADPTSPIPSHCASIVATSTLRDKFLFWILPNNGDPYSVHNDIVCKSHSKPERSMTSLMIGRRNQSGVIQFKCGLLFHGKWRNFAEGTCTLGADSDIRQPIHTHTNPLGRLKIAICYHQSHDCLTALFVLWPDVWFGIHEHKSMVIHDTE